MNARVKIGLWVGGGLVLGGASYWYVKRRGRSDAPGAKTSLSKEAFKAPEVRAPVSLIRKVWLPSDAATATSSVARVSEGPQAIAVDEGFIDGVMNHLAKHMGQQIAGLAPRAAAGDLVAIAKLKQIGDRNTTRDYERVVTAMVGLYAKGTRPPGFDPGRWGDARAFAEHLEAKL